MIIQELVPIGYKPYYRILYEVAEPSKVDIFFDCAGRARYSLTSDNILQIAEVAKTEEYSNLDGGLLT